MTWADDMFAELDTSPQEEEKKQHEDDQIISSSGGAEEEDSKNLVKVYCIDVPENEAIK